MTEMTKWLDTFGESGPLDVVFALEMVDQADSFFPWNLPSLTELRDGMEATLGMPI